LRWGKRSEGSAVATRADNHNFKQRQSNRRRTALTRACSNRCAPKAKATSTRINDTLTNLMEAEQ
jgi:hypothetical protein